MLDHPDPAREPLDQPIHPAVPPGYVPAAAVAPPPVAQATPTRTAMPWLVLLLVILLGLLVVPYLAERIQYGLTRGDQLAKRDVALAVLKDMPAAEDRLAYVAHVVAPSVVGIDTVQYVDRPVSDEWLSFGPQEARGEGSGVIVDASGYIITNYHVVSQAAQLTVKLADGRTVDQVRIIGRDPLTDLAVLKIKADNLVAAKFGDSDDLEPGDQVLAIGNPYGLARTVTSGIISATQRRAPGLRGLQDFLQTDAAVNPGNSGGPLVNMRAEIVGINTAIYGNAYQGISFAIPSHVAMEVYGALKTGERISRGWLGVAMQEITPDLAKQLGLESAQGALVAGLVPGAPAARAGIRRGDVIVAVNSQEVRDPIDLSRAVAAAEAGSRATVDLIRDGEKMRLEVTVAERPPEADEQGR